MIITLLSDCIGRFDEKYFTRIVSCFNVTIQQIVVESQQIVVNMASFARLFPNPSFVDTLILFLTHPDDEIYQSRVVISTGWALMQVQRALKRLEETGLITKTKSGNRIYYKANKKHPAFEDIKNNDPLNLKIAQKCYIFFLTTPRTIGLFFRTRLRH